ncbi:MAG: MotA/TolQ/ExbB proton channel family protein [Phycisphaerales bacterium]
MPRLHFGRLAGLGLSLWRRASILAILVMSSGPAVAQSEPSEDAEISFGSAFFFSQDAFGTMIIWFLILLSAASLGLIGFMWLNNRRVNIAPPGVVGEVRRLVETKDYRQLLNLTEGESSYFSNVMAAALREASHGFNAMIRALEQAGDEYTTRRLRRIELLNVIGNVAPMIGLFGTVYGMILAFQGIVAAGGRPDPVDLAGGIGTALTTTFWGLIVAIPSLAGYAVIRNNIDALTSEASLTAEEILNQFRPAATPAKSAPKPARPSSTTPPANPGEGPSS